MGGICRFEVFSGDPIERIYRSGNINNIMGFPNFFKKCRPNPGCRNCRVNGIHGSLLAQFPDIQMVEGWKFGHLYQCSICTRFWFLHEHKQFLNRIHDQLLPLAHHWNETPLTLDDPTLDILASIGGVAEYYKDYIAIPCCVKNVSGEEHEKAVVLVSKQPPYFWYEPQLVHWADEIKGVTPSPFALPVDVRKASSKKEEIAMGFAPVGVMDKTGTEYTLPCECRFFDYKGVKGEEILLSGRKGKWQKNVSPSPPQAYYFVDWFDGCDEMLMEHSSK